MEYVIDCCIIRAGQQRQFCRHNPWTNTEKFKGIPAPYPDKSKLPKFRYKNVFETPFYYDEVSKIFCTVDDFFPRAQLKIEFSGGTVCLEKPNSIKEISDEYIVAEDHIRSYVNHLLFLQRAKDIRINQRKRDEDDVENKSYEDYDWIELFFSRDAVKKTNLLQILRNT